MFYSKSLEPAGCNVEVHRHVKTTSLDVDLMACRMHYLTPVKTIYKNVDALDSLQDLILELFVHDKDKVAVHAKS
jgi:hypothetical protein